MDNNVSKLIDKVDKVMLENTKKVVENLAEEDKDIFLIELFRQMNITEDQRINEIIINDMTTKDKNELIKNILMLIGYNEILKRLEICWNNHKGD
jgi:broad-specificity NMP kinase